MCVKKQNKTKKLLYVWQTVQQVASCLPLLGQVGESVLGQMFKVGQQVKFIVVLLFQEIPRNKFFDPVEHRLTLCSLKLCWC